MRSANNAGARRAIRLLAGLLASAPFPSGAERGAILAPPPQPYAFPVAGPYSPYSDLVPFSGRTGPSPFSQLPPAPGPNASDGFGAAPYSAPVPHPAAPYPAAPDQAAPHPWAPYADAPYPPTPLQAGGGPPGSPPAYAPPAAGPPFESAAARSAAKAEERGGFREDRDPPLGLVSEALIGVLRHDAGVFGRHEEKGIDADFELRFVAPALFDFMASPRPHFGLHVNSAGRTSQAFAGLTWEWPFYEPFFLDFSFGLAVHDGKLRTDELGWKELGSRVLFREALELGWNVAGGHSIVVLLDHVSHGHILASKNEGMDSLGLRYGYRF